VEYEDRGFRMTARDVLPAADSHDLKSAAAFVNLFIAPGAGRSKSSRTLVGPDRIMGYFESKCCRQAFTGTTQGMVDANFGSRRQLTILGHPVRMF
jgi:hypothetical protein